jgi:hypothetical protein
VPAGAESLTPALAMKKSVVCCSHLVRVPSAYILLHSRDVNIFCALRDSSMSAIGVWLSCAFCSACMAASLSRVSARCRLF